MSSIFPFKKYGYQNGYSYEFCTQDFVTTVWVPTLSMQSILRQNFSLKDQGGYALHPLVGYGLPVLKHLCLFQSMYANLRFQRKHVCFRSCLRIGVLLTWTCFYLENQVFRGFQTNIIKTILCRFQGVKILMPGFTLSNGTGVKGPESS